MSGNTTTVTTQVDFRLVDRNTYLQVAKETEQVFWVNARGSKISCSSASSEYSYRESKAKSTMEKIVLDCR